MYILIIARGYPTEKYKMNGNFEFDQAKTLFEYGYEVIYAAIDGREHPWDIYEQTYYGLELWGNTYGYKYK